MACTRCSDTEVGIRRLVLYQGTGFGRAATPGANGFSRRGLPAQPGAEAQTFRHGSSRALIQSLLTDQSLAYSYVPFQANSLGTESFAISTSHTGVYQA